MWSAFRIILEALTSGQNGAMWLATVRMCVTLFWSSKSRSLAPTMELIEITTSNAWGRKSLRPTLSTVLRSRSKWVPPLPQAASLPLQVLFLAFIVAYGIVCKWPEKLLNTANVVTRKSSRLVLAWCTIQGTVSEEVFHNTNYQFIFSSRQIPHLDEFKGEKLRLRSFTLMELPEAVFSLTQLTTLNAYNNCLETIPPTITQLVSLKKLQLAQNSLTCIPSFKDMPALSLLSLSHNQLGALFASIADSTAFWPPSLTDMQLDDNHIFSLPDNFANLSSLTALSVRNNNIVTLPPSFFTLTALQHLVMAGNQIQELRIDGGLSSLTSLDLADNKITRLSLNLPSLRNLYIQDNQISTLGPEIASLPSLEFFSAQNNMIEIIASDIGQLSHLSFLSLCNNRLTTFPLSLAFLSSLTL